MAETIIFDLEYMENRAKHLKTAKSYIDQALEKLKKAKMSGSWLCPERSRINSDIEFYEKSIKDYADEIEALANALLLGATVFNGWETSMQGSEQTLSSELKEKFGFDATVYSENSGEEETKLSVTPIPQMQSES
jgi:prefoldin subunit 5